MVFGYFTLFVALLIEIVGAYYSITGLAAIFSGAVVPILIMGGSLEIGKVTAAVWLKNNWHRASLQFKLYLLPAVTLLMFITSMGIFGFLSKAHNDQNLVSGDVTSKIAIYDEKIKIQKDNIESARRALQQMDSAVDQTMSRSNDEKGADKATAIRRSQARERGNLQNEIAKAQGEIVKLNDLRAPIAAEVRKVEAEVGPIKYIAKLIYGDNPDQNILEKAVVWVIIMIVAVFDPLALVLILAAQQSIRWAQGKDQEEPISRTEYLKSLREKFFKKPEEEPSEESAYTTTLENLEPVINEPIVVPEDYDTPKVVAEEDYPFRGKGILPSMPLSASYTQPLEHEPNDEAPIENQIKQNKESVNVTPVLPPQTRLEAQAHKAIQLEIDALSNAGGSVTGFGSQFPAYPRRGDMFLRTDQLPTALYKFNGQTWILTDKDTSTSYVYDDAYIDHLIEKIATGEYDADLLNAAEQERIEQRLNPDA
jgi:hypothetical protein